MEKQERKLGENVVGDIKRFKYLRSVVHKDWIFEEDMKYRTKCE